MLKRLPKPLRSLVRILAVWLVLSVLVWLAGFIMNFDASWLMESEKGRLAIVMLLGLWAYAWVATLGGSPAKATGVTDDMVEKAARELFLISLGGQFKMHHWPGDEPFVVDKEWAVGHANDASQDGRPLSVEFGTEGPSQAAMLAGIRSNARKILEAAV